MKLTRGYGRVRFSPTVIREALARLESVAGPDVTLDYYLLDVYRGADKWSFDAIDEFTADLANDYSAVQIEAKVGRDSSFSLYQESESRVAVESADRLGISRVFTVFDDARESCSLAPEPPPAAPELTVFIGHGRSLDWRDLKEHLTDKQGVKVVAYEVGSRAGHTIRDILDEMLSESSMAILVMTGEDETAAGKLRARQNVVHETGLFQGRLGFGRALVVAQDGIELYSNLDGIQQIRYRGGNIRESFGDVVAAIRKEFPSAR
jgi:Predicted nucleotide-binding protein containing TIR-like domain